MIPELLSALQREIPLTPRPFATLGAAHQMSEETVLARAQEWAAAGLIRRFGAVFEGRRLGYASTLCAMTVPAATLATVAAQLTPLAGITHCYARSGSPNLWFTFNARQSDFSAALWALRTRFKPFTLHSMPARRTFKIAAIFGDSKPASGANHALAQGPALILSNQEQDVVRLLQGSLPLTPQPFTDVAAQAGLSVGQLLALCQGWLATGIMRRFGLIMQHHALGFTANCMCAWRAPPAQLETAGETVAASTLVTHCYERSATSDVPYNLYAMLHAQTRDAVLAECATISTASQLGPAQMYWSLQEFKKTSPRYFVETEDALAN